MVRHRSVLILVVLSAALVALVTAYHLAEASPPARSAVPGILGRSEGVKVSEIDIVAYAVKHGRPAVLYRLTDQPFRAPNGFALTQPLKLSFLVHPAGEPWKWTEGGGGFGLLPPGNAGASFELLSASGDTGTPINTEIFGAVVPDAAQIQLTVNGTHYSQDVHRSEGYIFLLPDKNVRPENITEFRVLDASGQELPPPRGIGGQALVPPA